MNITTKKPKVLILVGPTGSGKTSLSINLAKRFNGEIISADSRQVYRGLDIGTAKVTKEETNGISHHLIDIRDIDDTYTVTDFKQEAEITIDDILKRERLPIITGGTFFYIDALLGRVRPAPVAPNAKLREELEKKTVTELATRLEKLDPNRYSTIDRDNKRRLIRALEIINELDFVPTKERVETSCDELIIGLKTEKGFLRENYAKRAVSWLEQGFKKEVLALLERGVSRERLQEIGFEYTLMLELLDSKINEVQFIQKFVEKNWQYAKRQMTWLRRDQSIKWFERDDAEIFVAVERFLGE